MKHYFISAATLKIIHYTVNMVDNKTKYFQNIFDIAKDI